MNIKLKIEITRENKIIFNNDVVVQMEENKTCKDLKEWYKTRYPIYSEPHIKNIKIKNGDVEIGDNEVLTENMKLKFFGELNFSQNEKLIKQD